MRYVVFMLVVFVSLSPLTSAVQLYGSDFERDTVGQPPDGWEVGFDGAGEATVISDPIRNGNKVFAHSDLAQDQARHDVGGVIWVVGDDGWQDYIVEYDAYFPTDFYMGSLFRFQEGEAFYLFDRRQGGPTFDFWKRQAGGWTNVVAGGAFGAQPEEWYRFRLEIEGDTFNAYAKEIDDDTPFSAMEPLLTGTDGAFESGKFGLYGLIYIDNIVIGETEDDLVLAVEPSGKLAVSWGSVKSH